MGKTCLLYTYVHDTFPNDWIPTVSESYVKNSMWNGKAIGLALWDTAGHEEYDRLRPLSYPQTDVFLLCFAVNNRESFNHIKSKWIDEITLHCEASPYLLVGLKSDLNVEETKEDIVTREEAEELAKEIDAYKYVQVSAMNGVNVRNTFDEAIAAVMNEGIYYETACKAKSLQEKQAKSLQEKHYHCK